MVKKRNCSKCGTPLPADPGLKGLCPRCLLVLGLGADEAGRKKIGSYEILGELGRGAMGVVYKAYQVSLNRIVALKVLSEHLAQDAVFIQRFQREAKSAAQLNHPNVVTIHDIDCDGDTHFIAMEYVKGKTLSELVQEQGQLDVPHALRIVQQVLKALGAAHELGIIHRDVKAQNVMIDNADCVKVADFGLAKTAEDIVDLTLTGAVLGTPAYMAPEQCKGDPIDHRVDVYAVGVLLYQMLAGRVPFPGKTLAEVIQKTLNEPVPPIDQFNSEVPDAVFRIITRALAKHPADRYASAEEMEQDTANALAHYEAQTVTKAPGKAEEPTTSRHVGRHRRLWQAAAAALVIGVIGLGLVKILGPSTPDSDPPVFTDPMLEATVRQAVGKLHSVLTKEDLSREDFTTLSAPKRGISSIEGIGACAKLQHVDFNYNPISDVAPLSQLAELMEVEIRNTQVRDIGALASLAELKHLLACDCQIEKIDALAGLNKLNELHIGGNPIQSVEPLRNLTALESLNLTSVNLSGSADVLAGLVNLTGLFLGFTHLTDIGPVQHMPRLVRLHLHNNNIEDIAPLAALEQLDELGLQGNRISNIEALAGLENLRTVIFQDNQITDIGPLVANAGLDEGDKVDLRENPLSREALERDIPALQARGVEVLYDAPGEMQGDRPNLLTNSSYEEMSEPGKPLSWSTYTWEENTKDIAFELSDVARSGSHSVTMSSEQGGDGYWLQHVEVTPYTNYRLSGWVKTEDIASKGGLGAYFLVGPRLGTTGGILPSREFSMGTHDWTQQEFVFNSLQYKTLVVFLLFGGGDGVTGKAWFDDLSLTPMTSVERASGEVVNGSFQEADGKWPLGWSTSTWSQGHKASLKYANVGHTGSRSVSIVSTENSNASWLFIAKVRPHTNYRLSGWIKTDNVVSSRGVGARLVLHDLPFFTRALKGANDWTQVEVPFNSGENELIKIGCQLDGSGNAAGQAWFDDVELEELPDAGLTRENGVTNVLPLNTSYMDDRPSLTGDGLTLFFMSYRPGGKGSNDLYSAKRDAPGAPWRNVTNVGELNSEHDETEVCVRADGLELFFCSLNRPGGKGDKDIWRATRDSQEAPWSEPRPQEELNSAAWDSGPALTADGLTIFFHSKREGGSGDSDIYQARRESLSAPFGEAKPVAELCTPQGEHLPCISADGKTIVFASSREDSDSEDIWFATREDESSKWSAPKRLEAVNSSDRESSPWLSADGNELYIRSYRNGVGGRDIWVLHDPFKTKAPTGL